MQARHSRRCTCRSGTHLGTDAVTMLSEAARSSEHYLQAMTMWAEVAFGRLFSDQATDFKLYLQGQAMSESQ